MFYCPILRTVRNCESVYIDMCATRTRLSTGTVLTLTSVGDFRFTIDFTFESIMLFIWNNHTLQVYLTTS